MKDFDRSSGTKQFSKVKTPRSSLFHCSAVQFFKVKTMEPISFILKENSIGNAKKLLSSKSISIPDELTEVLRSAIKGGSMDLPDMIRIFEWQCSISSEECDEISALSLLEDTSMVLPELPKRDPNPELQKRLKRLAAQQANKDYDKMVENVSTVRDASWKPKKTKSTAISGLNFAITLFASCGATIYLLQNMIPDLGIRAGIGIAVGTVILMIEIFLAVREIERQQKEK